MSKKSSFEITTLAVQETCVVELCNADDTPLYNAEGERLSVTVYGPGSKAYQKAQATRNQRLMERLAKKGKVQLSAEEQVREQAELLAACTASFNGWVYKGSADAAAFLAAYADPAIGFIAEQVGKAVGDWANFTVAPLTS